ncbi:MAG: sialate O-acetylesterase [Clostridia bacterium]|nr:sialate O-acetylesterase [Clostridia bacterium]
MKLALFPPFGDGMVLQRDREIEVWGAAAPGKAVSVTFQGIRRACRADDTGRWSVFLPPLSFGGPYAMAVACGGEAVTVGDILVGEVWVCGGQSNMEMKMDRVRHMFPEEFENPRNPHIRQFDVPQTPRLNGPQTSLESGRWREASPETVADFSAAGYFFAKRLYEKYRVPIGLLAAAVGGTPIHAWMSRAMLRGFPDVLAEADACARPGYIQSVQREESARTAAYMEALDRDDAGLQRRWYDPAYDDSGWAERPLCAAWDGDLRATGSVWFRNTLVIPPELAGKQATLFLGTIVDADTAYANGAVVGSTAYRYPPRGYAIPALPEGRCVLALRVLSQYGQGGFTPGKPRMLVCGGRGFDLNGMWKYRRGTIRPPMPRETNFAYKPTGLYNGMIAPLHRWPVKGVLWYQGESDAAAPTGYRIKFTSLIQGWRKGWKADLPFLFVQLSHYADTGGMDWDALRQEQLASLAEPGTALIFSGDVGEYNDLHPQNKQAVGDRLARAAMRVAYGEDMPASPFTLCGPLPTLAHPK